MASTTPEAIPASTWVTDNKLKWTALERMFRGEKAKRLTAEVHNPTLPELANKTVVQREAIIEKKLKLLGVRGEPMFSELSYFNPCQFFRLGIAHIFLLGLVKDFWKHCLMPIGKAWTAYVLPQMIRDQISARAPEVLQTELFGKPYTDLIKYRGCWMMEEWMAFTDTYSLDLLSDLEWPVGTQAVQQVFEEQWSLLRPAVVYFLKYLNGQHTEDRIVQAQKWLLSYGSSAEQVFGGRSITTFKLHLAAVHLEDQVRACGAGFFSTEYWVERMVQLLKRMIKYRTTAYPELLFVHDWLLVLACRRVRRTVEGKDLETLEEALESIRAAKRKVHDQPDAAGSYLAGAAKEVEEEEKTEVLPPYEAPAGVLDVVEPAGLPLLLHTDPALASEGWPTFPGDPPGTRADWIYSELGLGVAGREVRG